jgi:breast cancer 2 susceptibility protein
MISSLLGDQIAKPNNPKPFKPPLLMQRAIGNRGTSSPLNPASQLSGIPAFTTAGSQHPLVSTHLTIGATKPGANGSATFTTPARIVKRSGVGPRKDGPSPFVTPFKAGMKPGQPGRLQLEQSATDIATLARSEKPKESSLTRERSGSKAKAKGISRTKVFDLSAISL